MSRDDMEHFESRMGDKALFQNIALFLLSASVPLLIEKYIDYRGSESQTDLAIIIVCIAGIIGGVISQFIALNRRKRVSTFKDQLFRSERRLSTNLTMVDTSGTGSQYDARSAV